MTHLAPNVRNNKDITHSPICANGVLRDAFTSVLSLVTRTLTCDVDRSDRRHHVVPSGYFILRWFAVLPVLS